MSNTDDELDKMTKKRQVAIQNFILTHPKTILNNYSNNYYHIPYTNIYQIIDEYTESQVRKATANEKKSHGDTIDSRDRAEDAADELVLTISRFFKKDFGEHSSANNPWWNAIHFMENYKKEAQLQAPKGDSNE